MPVRACCRRGVASCRLPWRGDADQRSTPRQVVSRSSDQVHLMRNIGIMAHIDAGKTTLTERLLFYSGAISRMGEVHHGTTTMDFMEQERQRGITIGAAAISFNWRQHQLNLVDTPGHVDFTIEVQRALRVLDAGVVVLDATAGVQAQTVTVWRQAAEYALPALAFVNKMDRPSADVAATLASVGRRLTVPPLMLQMPVFVGDGGDGGGGQFCGVVDLPSMRLMVWSSSGNVDRHQGAVYDCVDLVSDERYSSVSPASSGAKAAECGESLRGVDLDGVRQRAAEARQRLVEETADLDDQLATVFLQASGAQDVDELQLTDALRRVTLARRGLPTLCGSAYRNVAVQPLLDAVCLLLPSPAEAVATKASSGAVIERYRASRVGCALAFKTVHDQQRGGALTYVRVYSGRLVVGGSGGGGGVQRVYNVNRRCYERVARVMTPHADRLVDGAAADTGSIVVLSGLQKTVTGDTLLSRACVLESPSAEADSVEAATEPEDTAATAPSSPPAAGLLGVRVPPAVFSCSIEAPSPATTQRLEAALQCLQREDPSLRCHVNRHTGQLVMSGMGELHLQVTHERIRREFGVDAEVGVPQVAYLETVAVASDLQHELRRDIAGQLHQVTVHLHLDPVATPNDSPTDDSETSPARLELLHRADNVDNLAQIHRRYLKAVENGMRSALSCGPLVAASVVCIRVRLSWLSVAARTAEHVVAAASAACVRRQLQQPGVCRLLEPIMRVHVVCGSGDLTSVMADLTCRRASVVSVDVCNVGGRDSGERAVVCDVPLAELRDYASALRRISSGNGSFSMQLLQYAPMTDKQQQIAITSITGVA